MEDCRADDPRLPALFDPQQPNNPALWAVFNGRHTGRALVDDLAQPGQCVVRTDAALSYASRKVTLAFLQAAVERLRRYGPVWLIWPQRELPAIPAIAEASLVRRLAFDGIDPGSRILIDLRARLPRGFTVRLTDRSLLARCEWRDEMAFYCGSLENFLRNAAGVCLLQAGEIVAEAYASSLGDSVAEIGALTRAAQRGKGYAPIACAYLIEILAGRGFLPSWSCDADHQASIRVAKKLGFQYQRAYQILEWEAA